MIVVTGGAGFIGSALVWALNKQGRKDIIVVDEANLSDEKKQNLSHLKLKDYLDKDPFIEKIRRSGLMATKKTEAVIHMGACSDTTETNEQFLMENNYEYTKTLCKYCLNNKVRFIYASSAATYGDGSKGYSDSEQIIDRLKPLNLYGKSKQLFDKWAKDNKLLDKIVGLKYFNVFGPNEYHKGEMRSVVLKAYQQIKATGKMRLFKSYRAEYADGEQKRDFLYIKDAVDMTLFFLDRLEVNGIFNVGSGIGQPWNELANAIFKALGKKPDIEYFDMPEELKERYQYFTQADISKLRNAGYDKSITPLEESVRDYVQNYLIPHSHLA
ncbi:MAG: ADP-glyceromanno-heptose 6-epimerase [Candidatus Omnitrophota bacterium]|nr:MAG: ADP-glyceromanno-heptose 6-epimerase [Candidatus Omnitrophota bacterium]